MKLNVNYQCDDAFEGINLSYDDQFREACNVEYLFAGMDNDNEHECGQALNVVTQAAYTCRVVLELMERIESGEVASIIGNQEATLENALKTDKVTETQGVRTKTLAQYLFLQEYQYAHNTLDGAKESVNDFMSCHQTAHTNCHQIA